MESTINEAQYFEQFVGDDNQQTFYYIPMSTKQLQALSQLEKEHVLAIAQVFSIPMSVWLGQTK